MGSCRQVPITLVTFPISICAWTPWLVDADKQAVIVHSNDPNNSIREGKSVEIAVNVAFSTGLFSMTEIAFDKEQRRALVSYSFVCGSLCGSRGVWLFERVDGVWKKSERACGGWISQPFILSC